MPGDVIDGHSKFEHNCANCHNKFDRTRQKHNCLACHKKIQADVKNLSGYHGKNNIVREQECNTCHTEHKGRKADIIKFNPLTFDHTLTDFVLKGQHKNLECYSCHKKNTKYRDAPQRCSNCHKNDSNHSQQRMGKILQRCDGCHVETGWQQTRYRHKKSGPLHTGRHKKTQCINCHIAGNYVSTPTQCISCHKGEDIHRGKNGKACQKCHSTWSWKKLKFDHAKDTNFALRGRHASIDCQACHKNDPYRIKIKSTCISCHKHDDIHRGVFGAKCQTCHQAVSWPKAYFDHNKKTNFRLQDSHAKLSCQACHKVNAYKHKLASDCYSCHKINDVHHGQQGKKCSQCHNTKGWREKVRFDHDLTRFPLIGLHSVVPCEECHLSNNYKQASIQCEACHKTDDEHRGRLGKNCQMCHNPNGWKIWRFNHNTQSQFHLDGAHTNLHCYSCHITPTEEISAKPRSCQDCHRGDDPHNGQFGSRCDRCHSTSSFRDIRMQR